MILSHSTKKRMFDRIRMLFGGAPCVAQAAALPWRLTGGGVEVMLVTSRSSGRWVLPKGWPERHEELWQAAEREALEEAGVSGAITRRSFGSFFYGKDMPRGMQYRCEVQVYPRRVDNEAEKWAERRERKRVWYPAAEAARLVDESDLAELIAGFGDDTRKLAA